MRLILGEYGIEARHIEERFWERREEFLLLNPAGDIPVLVAEGEPPIPGGAIIAEYHRGDARARAGRPAAAGSGRASASRCAGWRAGSTTNSTPR